MRLIANIRTFAQTFRISIRATMMSKLSAFFSFLNTITVITILFLIFSVAFGREVSIQGVSFAAAMWSLGMYSFSWGVGAKNVAGDIANCVKDGSIETKLVRPQHFLSQMISVRLGKQWSFFLVQFFVNVGLVFLFVGRPPVAMTFGWWASILTLFVCGMTVAILMYACIGIISFWLEDVMPLLWITDKSTMVLGGSFVPVALLPLAVQHVAERSPFGAVMNFTRAFTDDFADKFWSYLLPQLFWMVFFGVLCAWLWRLGRRKVSINGG